MGTTTTRLAIRKPAAGDPPVVHTDIGKVADDIDALAAPIYHGTAAARPAANTLPVDSLYWATDTGVLSHGNGSGNTWIDISPPSNSAAGTPSLRKLGTGATDAAAGNDSRLSDARNPIAGSVDLTALASALKPSAGAGAGAEAVRALGTGAANAAAGNDARLSDARTPSAGSVIASSMGVLPNCRVVGTFGAGRAGNSSAAIPFSVSETADASGMHSTSVNPSRITIAVAGLYRVFAKVAVISGTTKGLAVAYLQRNGSTYVSESGGCCDGTSGDPFIIDFYDEVYCSAGEYLEMYTTGPANCTFTDSYQAPIFGCSFISA